MVSENGVSILVFALCLAAAGGLLSLTTRIHGLVMVLVGIVLACCAVVFVRSLDGTPAVPLGVTVIVALGALQIGYGVGVVARGAFEARSRRSPRPAGIAPTASPEGASKSRTSLARPRSAETPEAPRLSDARHREAAVREGRQRS